MSETYPEPASELPNALPDAWVQRIFKELSLTFGSRFADLWAGVDPVDLQRKWAQGLARFDGAAIRGALEACEQPGMIAPTLPVFRGLCADAARRNAPTQVLLPAPEISDARREEIAAGLARIAKPQHDGRDYKLWAKKLRTLYLAGENLIEAQISHASEALHEVWEAGQCRRLEVSA